MHTPTPTSERFRVVGAIGATGIIVASMVGSGIFTLTGKFGAQVGSERNVLAAWVIGGVLALAGGLSLAELGAMIPCSGGSVEFARRAFGRTTGYLVAMVTILSGYFLSIAAVGLMLAEYVNKLAPEPLDLRTVAIATIVLAFLSQLPGLRAGYAFNTGLSVLKIGFVAAFVAAGLLWPLAARVEPSAAAAAVSSATAFARAAPRSARPPSPPDRSRRSGPRSACSRNGSVARAAMSAPICSAEYVTTPSSSST